MYTRIDIGFRLPRAGAELETLSAPPPGVRLSLAGYGRTGPLSPTVADGERVRAGTRVAAGPAFDLHASIDGVAAVSGNALAIRGDGRGPWTVPANPALEPPSAASDFPAFLAAIGAVGMGGGLFPAALKLRASGAVGTVVVNGVECEPGVSIDQAILLRQPEAVQAGVAALQRATGARTVVLAVKKDRATEAQLARLYPAWRILTMRAKYPAGAEKLILKRLTGRRLPAGGFPFHVGCLVHNVATLRAVGRALRDGVPFVERPLSVVSLADGIARNLIVPAGMEIGVLLETCGCPAGDPARRTIVAGGLMMGRRAAPGDRVTLGTTSLFVLPAAWTRARERACIRCGSCFDVCPLGLHPIELAGRLEGPARRSRLTRAQADDCFLCGACSAVCPSHIPIAHRIREERHV